VSEANLARQCFCEADIGQPKALVLAQRLRAFYSVPV
jgi:molybdopterin/thiamine biosynthesis adenylyltransferase